MSLSCSCDSDGDGDWYWGFSDTPDFSVLTTKRYRKCCCCKRKIVPGQEVLELPRWRSPSERCNYIEEKIYGDEVPLAPYFMCEECGGLAMAVMELGMCFDIGEPMRQQIREYMKMSK